MKEAVRWSIRQIRDAIKRRDVTVREVVQAHIERIQNSDDRLRAFLTVNADAALAQAADIDRRLQDRELRLGFLTGIPIAVKDNMVTRGVRTTCGSKILSEYVPPYTATAVRRLQADGAVLIGKTNLDEFAMGSSTENSGFFPTRNPWDLERVPGGSSGGSAAAVGAFQAPGALGSDTGGSVRQPAAFCGVVGLKPTYGRVSRYGLVAFGSSLDQIGPLARTARDAASILQVISGHDPRDSTSSSQGLDGYVSEIGKDVHSLRVGVPREWFGTGLEPEVRRCVEETLKRLEVLGCRLEDVSLPNTEYAVATYYIVAPAEASSNLARYDGVKYGYRSPRTVDLESMYTRTRSEGFGAEVQRRIMIGTYVLSAGYYDAYFLKAGKVRTLIRQDYAAAFEKVDLLVGPTTPTLPFKLGEKTSDPMAMYLSDVYTVTANLAGIPALSMPCGFSESKLPVGLQILGPPFSEARMLRLAHALETELALEFPSPVV